MILAAALARTQAARAIAQDLSTLPVVRAYRIAYAAGEAARETYGTLYYQDIEETCLSIERTAPYSFDTVEALLVYEAAARGYGEARAGEDALSDAQIAILFD